MICFVHMLNLGNPEVIWYKGNEIIQDNDDFKYETSGDVHRLVIAEVFPEDSGIYRAEASNQTGTTSSHFTIFVKGTKSLKSRSCLSYIENEFSF